MVKGEARIYKGAGEKCDFTKCNWERDNNPGRCCNNGHKEDNFCGHVFESLGYPAVWQNTKTDQYDCDSGDFIRVTPICKLALEYENGVKEEKNADDLIQLCNYKTVALNSAVDSCKKVNRIRVWKDSSGRIEIHMAAFLLSVLSLLWGIH